MFCADIKACHSRAVPTTEGLLEAAFQDQILKRVTHVLLKRRRNVKKQLLELANRLRVRLTCCSDNQKSLKQLLEPSGAFCFKC